MLECKKVAITGGPSSGKSLACRFLKELGASVISADEIVHQLLTPTTEIGRKVIKLFGPEVASKGGIDRKYIAKIVFEHFDKLEALEELLHPEVAKIIDKKYEEAKRAKTPTLFVAEIPLLFEAKWEHLFDKTILIYATSHTRFSRFQDGGKGGETDFQAREARMIPNKLKKELSDHIIENNGSTEELQTQIHHIYTLLTQE